MRTSTWLLCGSIMIGLFVQISSGKLPNPRILEHPKDSYAARMTPVKLNCRAEGDPKPLITWYRNGAKVITTDDDSDSNKMLVDGGALFFLQVMHSKSHKTDLGIYYCNATNIHGTALSQNATLTLANLREDFKVGPVDTMVAIGDTAILKCRPPRGEPPPHVIWRKDASSLTTDSRITMEDEGDLILSSIEKSDGGDYTCVAVNKAGERESKIAKLTVYEKPRITIQPQDKIVEKGKNVELECRARGDPKPVITWRREKGQLPPDRFHLLDNGNLLIEEAEVSDDGLYICQVENSVGVSEAVAKLTVHAVPEFVISPTSKMIGLGRTLSLQCGANGSPIPAIYWRKGIEQDLMFPNRDLGRFSVDVNGTLHIRQVRFEDAGEYTCHAYNAAGSKDKKVHITVRELDPEIPDDDMRPPPIINMGPQNQTLQAKTDAVLPCQAHGDPMPTIQWLRNGRPLQMNNPRLMLLGTGSLKISDLHFSDTATYTCRAVSETGETIWSASLVVPSPEATNVQYHRAPQQNQLPGAPSQPEISSVTDTTVHLSWRPSIHKGGSPLYEFIVEYFSPQSGNGWVTAADHISLESYTVRKLKPNRNYIFLVRARNAHGISPPSPLSRMVETQGRRGSAIFTQEEIEQRLRGIVVNLLQGEASGPSAIKVDWQVMKGHSAIDGFKIKYRRSEHNSEIRTITVQDPTATSYLIENLYSQTWYEICIRAYGGKVFSQCSNPIKVHTNEGAPAAAPENIVIHWLSDSSMSVRWSPPPRPYRYGDVNGYVIRCYGEDRKDNCSLATNSSVRRVIIERLNPSTTYMLQMAAVTNKGTGTWSQKFYMVPEKPSIMRQPWFIGMLIGTIGGTVWIALCIVSIWLCRKKHTQKKLMEQSGMYSIVAAPLQKQEEQARYAVVPAGYMKWTYQYRNANVLSAELSQKEPQMVGNMAEYHENTLRLCHDPIYQKTLGGVQPDLTNIMDQNEMKDQNLYNRISMNVPQMKTFYQKPNPVSAVAPYATTTLINTSNLLAKPLQDSDLSEDDIHYHRIDKVSSDCSQCIHYCHMEPQISSTEVTYKAIVKPERKGSQSAFRPINQGYGHHGGSGSSDSCLKPDMGSSDTDNSRPNTDILMDHEIASPGSDSGSYTADETGMPIKRGRRLYKTCGNIGKQPLVNWAELLPPPPEHPPPCEMISPDSPMGTLHRNIQTMNGGGPISPVSKISACSCPIQYSQGGLYGRNNPYSDSEQNKYAKIRENHPCSAKTLNQLRTQSPCGDMRTYSPRTVNCMQHNCMGHAPRCCHSDCEQSIYGPSLKGYRLPSEGEGDYRYISSDPERGPTPPIRMHSSNMMDLADGPHMDRACQSSLPSLANERMQSPLYPARLEVTASGPHLNIDFEGFSQNPDSPVSEIPDYAGESDLDDVHLDFGSPLTDGGDSSTEVQNDGFGNVTGKKHHPRRHHRAARPTSPYSTDSNFSAVVHKPYPKSQRKKQLMEQGNKKLSSNRHHHHHHHHHHQTGHQQPNPEQEPLLAQELSAPPPGVETDVSRYTPTHNPYSTGVADLPACNKPTYPTPSNPNTNTSPHGKGHSTTPSSITSGKAKTTAATEAADVDAAVVDCSVSSMGSTIPNIRGGNDNDATQTSEINCFNSKHTEPEV
ncbi:roundabout homolog 2 isoform X7 [Octopus sinensis]|uniref:Roundabout homolog 2 isoform X7 n=1 Tax=Octopus sinensis TaxID=2607531 RepID=A0A7E6EVH3_9MOLL|nr:roundabout homolog 2 isoform X7 [Octopus sinensis]